MVDTGNQNYSDVAVAQTITNDSEAVLLGWRFSILIDYPVVIKFDKNLNVVWKNDFAINTASIAPKNISLCKDGGFLIVGNIQNTGFTYSQPYILKIDRNGNKQWDKTISTLTGSGSFVSGIELSAGGFAFVGNTLQFGNGLNGNRIIFVKTDANGNF